MVEDRNSIRVPFISVITPTLNQGRFIEQTIQSVLQQNYPNFEHIVVDGGSTDETIEILKRYSHLRWISEKDRGQSDALNKGLRMAKGEIIAWLNSDDYYPEKALERISNAFQNRLDARVIVGDCLAIVEGTDQQNRLYNRDLDFEDMIRYWDGWLPPHQPSVFFYSSLIREFGEFDVTLHRAMDYDFWLRISQKYPFIYIPEILSVYRFHPDSKSGLGIDWSSFYAEWHRVYLRYKSLSRVLPQQTLVTVALPFSEAQDSPYHSHPGVVRKAVERLQGQRFRDMEILIMTDSKSVALDFSNATIPVKVISVPEMDRDAFQKVVNEHASGFALHCPSPTTEIPAQWYAKPLDLLLDQPALKKVSDASLNRSEASRVNTELPPGVFELRRLDALKSFRYKISVVIPTCNRSDVLRRCLDALAAQTLSATLFEVVITDDGSTDSTAELVQNYPAFFSLTYLHQKNSGPAAARNAAIRRAKGEYILILNDDAIPAIDLLEEHLQTHKRLGTTRAAVLGSFAFEADSVHSPFMRLMQNSDFAFQYARMVPEQFYDWRYFWTCNISLPRPALDETGLFDEDFREPAGEDTELGYRFFRSGYKIFYQPLCKADHSHQLVFSGFCQRQISVGRNLILLAIKHPELTKELLYFQSIPAARSGATKWLIKNEPMVQKAFQAIVTLEAGKVSQEHLDPTKEMSRMLIDFQLVNKYFIYQGFLSGIERQEKLYSATRTPPKKYRTLRLTFVLAGTALSGGTRILLEYANRLAQRGHVVSLISLSTDRPDWFQVDTRVRYSTSGWSDSRLEFDIPESDVVIATQWATSYYVARLSPAKGSKVYFIQSYESETITTPEQADLTYLLPMHRIAVSLWLSQELKQRFRVTSRVVPNGIDLRSLFPEPAARQEHSSSEYRIGMLYHPEPRKGFESGLEAFRLIQKKIPEARLILMGTHRAADSKNYYEFYENLSPSEVRKFYSSLDVFVCASNQEGFGLTGLEAIACGIPLVTTDTGGSREYAMHAETALVCQPGDVPSLAESVIRLRFDSELRGRLIHMGLEKAKEFDWSTSVLKMEKYLVQIFAETPEHAISRRRTSKKVKTSETGEFYSQPWVAPIWLKAYWRLRDKASRWKSRFRYLLARRLR